MDSAISGFATSFSVCRFCCFRSGPARSGSLWRWERRCGPEHDVLWDQVGATWTHLSTAHSPPAREGAGMTYDAALHRVILFGGQDTNESFNDTWELSPTSTPTPTPSPTATLTPTPAPSATPAPRVTPRPRPTPHPRSTPR